MGPYVVSQDVAEELKSIRDQQAQTQAQLNFHERLHAQNAETLREVKDVLIATAKNTQQLQHIEQRFDSIDKRLDNHSDKITANHTQITKWVGGLGVMIFLIGSAIPVFMALQG